MSATEFHRDEALTGCPVRLDSSGSSAIASAGSTEPGRSPGACPRTVGEGNWAVGSCDDGARISIVASTAACSAGSMARHVDVPFSLQRELPATLIRR
jgi:hypothetical protein